MFCEGTISFRQLAGAVKNDGKRVLLLSDGPDELLGGYFVDRTALSWHDRLSKNQFLRAIPKFLAAYKNGRTVLRKVGLPEMVNFSYLEETPFGFRPIHGGTTPEVMDALFPDELTESREWPFGRVNEVYTEIMPHLDLSQRMALSYASASLPDYFNVRTDRAANWHSVECRLPLQAPHLAEFEIAAPMKWRYQGFSSSKYLMRKIVERRIGPEVAWRQKYGFSQPMWQIGNIGKKLNFKGVISESSVFRDLPFKPTAESAVQADGAERTRWFTYCLALTLEKLKSRNYEIDYVPDLASQG